LKTYLDRLITDKEMRKVKDVALALRLQHQQFGGLNEDHVAELHRLMTVATTNRGVWGMEEIGWLIQRMGWVDEFVQGSRLLPREVREYQDQFRRVILSTCMVIENLAPLQADYPEIVPTLDCAMKLWWTQFHGENAIPTLRNLFPKPYDFDYLRVVCRTLRAVRAYAGTPLVDLNTVNVHLLHELKANRCPRHGTRCGTCGRYRRWDHRRTSPGRSSGPRPRPASSRNRPWPATSFRASDRGPRRR
jgi:hypothetical protein